MAIALAVLLVAVPASPAQSDDDEDDWAEQDRRYMERLREEEQSPPAPRTPADFEQLRQDLVSEYLSEADRLIKDRDYSSRTSDHYRVKTDDPRLSMAAAASVLESFFTFFDQFFRERTELAAAEDQSPVYLFYSFYKYNQLLTGNKKIGEFRPSGHYRSFFDAVIIHSDAVHPEDLTDVLVHEAAHQLVAQRIYGGGGSDTLWLNEGLATYFGHTLQAKDGDFLAGRIGGKAVSLVNGEPAGASSLPRQKVQLLRKWLRSNPDFTLDALMRMTDPSRFYGEGAEMRYTASWLLVHYLLHAEGGAHAEALVRYIEADAAGEASAQSLYDAVGMDAGGLQQAYLEYVKKLKLG